MFHQATKNFVEEVEVGGCLIPVDSPNQNISVLTLVVKHKSFWFWKKDKYTPTDFQLNDVLTGQQPIKPDVAETDFMKYTGNYGDKMQGNVDAGLIPWQAESNVTLAGKESSKLQTSFGCLKKEEVHMQKLLEDCKDRVLDMSHCLISQTKDKPRRSFGIVKERIVTTQPCSVIEEQQKGGQFGIDFKFCVSPTSKVFLKDNAGLTQDSNVAMEIPIHSTIAFAINELKIGHDGHFELCLMSDTKGGFEVDGLCQRSMCVQNVSISPEMSLKKELWELRKHFQVLLGQPVSICATLLKQFPQILEEPWNVSALLSVLDQVLEDETSLKDIITSKSQSQNVHVFLEDLEKGVQGEQRPVLEALQLILSAMDEMTEEGLAMLRICCSFSELHILDHLVQELVGEIFTLPSCDKRDIHEEAAVRLFASSNMSLTRRGGKLKVGINPEAGHRPIVLCIAIKGLASLAH